MPESKGRKPKKKAAPKKSAVPRKPVLPVDEQRSVPPWEPRKNDPRSLDMKPPNRSPIKEIPEDELPELPDLPEPPPWDEVLVALAKLDPLEQEVLIAQRIATMPSQKDGGMPVNVPRYARAPWARQLRKLGFFCIPELATHELVADPGGGMMANHTAARVRKLSRDDFWEMAKQQSPELGRMVDEAKTPEQKKEAMATLAKNLPVEIRIAFERLMSHDPEELAPR
ncbi:hypothetical protein SEA_LITTLELAF_53 [Mycobacterium phage LittleLaf]|uniref:Uncharacterized protein n=14 Tax=Marvinvirus TaxID=1982091 RepID=A0A3S9U916_9CAUD|nr:hypothetical protein FH33_gp051 [Mycobacterium phage MosMoris]YP_009614168.1 hypothetical protein FDI61_gp050 [Mycobacterium phage Marvin]ANM46275.1 hypothetical protein SEA_GATTACA_52 [Mycobacterium phage Gattaca]AVE00797.1 hypothetical protein SEA_TESLA_51 [Mycobacterium phage Tesla]AYB69859.1 hypothetical protein SEA_LITTLELAF_53 [Mycobacterium phage LittleLaf]AYB70688.1 hypothetical protein SEA_VASUNZINGA_53 [Mycobacterium phage VasuNzinga]AZF93321.1 hypothetical protein SEA_BEELZEBUB_